MNPAVNPAAPSLSAAERELFLSSARSALKGPWPSATTAGTADAGRLGRVWDLAALIARGLGLPRQALDG